MLQPVDRMPTAPPIPPITVAGETAGARAAATTNAVTSQPTGGGYVFTAEEIDAVIKQWEGLYDEIENDERQAEVIADVKAPGLEFASRDFENVAGPSGDMLREQVGRMKKYVGDYIMALQDAKKATRVQDEQAANDVNDAAGGAV